MNRDLTDKQKVELADKEYKNLKKGRLVKLDDKTQIGYVSQVIDDKNTGMQAYVITENPPSAGKANAGDVTILYRGSSTGLSMDAYADWMGADIPAALDIVFGSDKSLVDKSAGQMRMAASTLDEMMAKYPESNFYVYGHSLGSMNGQYALANLSKKYQDRLKEAHLYQGPNIYKLLNKDQRNNVKSINNKIFNYVDSKDMVPIGYGKDRPMIGVLVSVLSKKSGLADQHIWGGYIFDDKGKLLTEDWEKSQLNKLNKELDVIRKKVSSGGALSTAEKLFLDAAMAREISRAIKTTSLEGIEILTAVYKDALEALEKAWDDVKDSCIKLGPDLSNKEVLMAMEEVGITRDYVVTKPSKYYQDKLNKLREIKVLFEETDTKVSSDIEKQIASDNELAQRFG